MDDHSNAAGDKYDNIGSLIFGLIFFSYITYYLLMYSMDYVDRGFPPDDSPAVLIIAGLSLMGFAGIFGEIIRRFLGTKAPLVVMLYSTMAISGFATTFALFIMIFR